MQDWFWVGIPLHAVTELPGASSPAEVTLRLAGGILTPTGHATEHQAKLLRVFPPKHPLKLQARVLDLAARRWVGLLGAGDVSRLAAREALTKAETPEALASALQKEAR